MVFISAIPPFLIIKFYLGISMFSKLSDLGKIKWYSDKNDNKNDNDNNINKKNDLFFM